MVWKESGRRPSLGFAAIAAIVATSSPCRAQDADFGCKVLLCAAASNPGWSGIAYCVPVMNQLFSILNSGGAWPSCPQANASGLAFKPYLACPAPNANYAIEGAGSSGCAGSLCGAVNPGSREGVGELTVNAGRYSSSIPVFATPWGPYCANPAFVQCASGRSGAGCALTSGGLTPATPNPTPDCVTLTPQGGSPFQFCFNLRGG